MPTCVDAAAVLTIVEAAVGRCARDCITRKTLTFALLPPPHTTMSRISRAVFNLSRAAAPQLRRNAFLFAPRAFSTSLVARNSPAANFLDMVKSEHKLATSIENELAPDHEEFLSSSGFKLDFQDKQSNVTMYKTLESGEELRVFFDIDEVTDISFANPEFAEDAVEQNLEDEAYQYESTFANVKVLVSHPEKNTGIFFNLMLQSAEESFFVDYFNHKDDVAGFLDSVNKNGEFLTNFEYQGPRFSNLDDGLQVAVETYLQSLGVDLPLAEFIFAYSEIKEEQLYRDLLGDVAAYLQQ